MKKTKNTSLKDKTLHLKLVEACTSGNLLQVMKWVEQGADIHMENELAFRCAAEYGHLPVVQYLVEQGADIHAENEQAFRWASEVGNLPLVQHLVSLGADIHTENEWALRLAAGNGFLSVVQYLVSMGADVSAGLSAADHGSSVNRWLNAFQRSQEERDILSRELWVSPIGIPSKIRL